MNKSEKKTSKKKWIKKAVAIAVGFVVLILIVIAALPKPVPVEIAKVEQGDIKIEIDEEGKTRVVDRYIISTPIAGNLERIALNPGDQIEKDQVVAKIFPLPPPLLDARSLAQAEAQLEAAKARKRQTSASIDQAKINLRYANKELDRQKLLAKSNGISKQSLEQAEQAAKNAAEMLESARFGSRVSAHELELAQATLDYVSGDSKKRNADSKTSQMSVKSPISGNVLKVFKRDAGAISLGVPLLEIGDPKALEIVVDVLSTDAVVIQKNAQVKINNWGNETSITGHVVRVEPAAFTRVSALGVEEQRVNVIVGIDSPYGEWKSLGDGYRVEVSIVVSEKQEVVKVPIGSMFRNQNEWTVFKVVDDSAVATVVKIGMRNDKEAEILEGLSSGETVILYPSDNVQDGVSIKPMQR